MKKRIFAPLAFCIALTILVGCKSDIRDSGGNLPYGTGTVTTAPHSSELEYKLSDNKNEYTVIGIGTCKSKNIVIPKTHEGLPVTAIENAAFAFTDIESVIIPSSVRKIGSTAFKSCASLVSADLGSGTVSIGKYAFMDCYSLKEIYLPTSVTSIGAEAFSECTALTSVIFASGIKLGRIESKLFASCSSLTSVIFEGESAITEVGKRAFHGCVSLEYCRLPDTVRKIDDNAYEGCTSLKELYIPRDLSSVLYTFTDCIFETVTVSHGNTQFSSAEGCLLSKDGFELFRASSSAVSIPDSVGVIQNRAFADLADLKEITLPPSLIRIGTDIFANCISLEYVKIPKGITGIDPLIFNGCTSLARIEVDKENPSLRSEGNCVISGDAIVLGCKDSVIPGSVTSIKHLAFISGGISEITVPGSVKSIAFDAFKGCPLRRIIYLGTKEEWKKLERTMSTYGGTPWFYEFPDVQIVCTNGTVNYYE